MGAVVEGGLPNVEPAQSPVSTASTRETSQPSRRWPQFLKWTRRRSPAAIADGQPRARRRNLGSPIFGLLKRLWIPLVVLAVINAGGFAVSRLHGIFGSDRSIAYGDTRNDAAKPFNPKHLRYEIFGSPGTVAQISYFDGNGDPKFIDGVSLPWSLEFPISTAASVGSIAAQGDRDSIGCRILVDGVVKSEKLTEHEASSFASCILKAA